MVARRQKIVLLRFQRIAYLHRAALAFTISLNWVACTTSTAQGYTFRGIQAPQVRSNPLVGSLQAQLRQLTDQLRDRSVRVDLNQAIEQSLLNNPDLAQSYSQIQQAQWTLIAVKRQWYPTLSMFSGGDGLLGYGGSYTKTTTTPSALSTDIQSTIQKKTALPILNMGWSFFDLSRGPQINATSETLRSQELLFNVATRNIILQTQIAYFNLQEQLELLKSYESNLASTSSQVSQTEALFNAGNASIADVEQIRTQQYQTLSLLISVYLSIIDASSSLAKAMALPPGRLVLPADQLALYGQWDIPLDATIKQALDLREEIKSSLAQASSAGWRASSLLNKYWPSFSLAAGGFYSYRNDESNSLNLQTGLSGSKDTRTSNWDGAVGLSFNWKVFDGGISAAQAQASRASQRQFIDQSAAQRLQISQEVELAYGAYISSRLSLLSSREQVKSAELAVLAVRERFKVGYADTTSVVQTLNQAISAANAYARSQRQYNIAIASLYRASAQWPKGTLALRNQRVFELEKR